MAVVTLILGVAAGTASAESLPAISGYGGAVVYNSQSAFLMPNTASDGVGIDFNGDGNTEVGFTIIENVFDFDRPAYFLMFAGSPDFAFVGDPVANFTPYDVANDVISANSSFIRPQSSGRIVAVIGFGSRSGIYGFRFRDQARGTWHYGWISVGIHSGQGWVGGWAYNATPSAAIRGGRTGTEVRPILLPGDEDEPFSDRLRNVPVVDGDAVGAVTHLSGDVSVTRTDGTVERVTLGTPIFEGDILETGEDGAAEIVFLDESDFRINHNARLAIDEYVYDAEAGEPDPSFFSLLRGLFLYTSSLIGRDNDDEVTIPPSCCGVGIRGDAADHLPPELLDVAVRMNVGSPVTLYTAVEVPDEPFEITFDSAFFGVVGDLEIAVAGMLAGWFPADEEDLGVIRRRMVTVDQPAILQRNRVGLAITFDGPAGAYALLDNFMMSGLENGDFSRFHANWFSRGPGTVELVARALTLESALKNDELAWETGGDSAWRYESTMLDEIVYAVARSGEISQGQASSLTTTVEGPGTLAFAWRTASEENADFLRFTVNGVERTTSISGATDWEIIEIEIENEDAHTLEWTFEQNSSSGAGQSAGYIDSVLWIPPPAEIISSGIVNLELSLADHDTLSLDINGNGEIDLRFEAGPTFIYLTGGFSSDFSFAHRVQPTPHTGTVRKVFAGTEIGESMPFSDWVNVFTGIENEGEISFHGPWQPGDSAYIGFSFTSGATGQRYYGWMEFEVVSADLAVIREWAWESQRGTSILAGDTGEGAPPVEFPVGDISFHLQISMTTRTGGESWGVWPRIETTSAEVQEQITVSSPGGHFRGYINHPGGFASSSFSFGSFAEMVGALQGEWSLSVDDGAGVELTFEVDTASVDPASIPRFVVTNPAHGAEVQADSFSADWTQPEAGTWNFLTIRIDKMDFSGSSPVFLGLEISSVLDNQQTAFSGGLAQGDKRMTLTYRNNWAGLPGLVVGSLVDPGGRPAGVEWQVNAADLEGRAEIHFYAVEHLNEPGEPGDPGDPDNLLVRAFTEIDIGSSHAHSQGEAATIRDTTGATIEHSSDSGGFVDRNFISDGPDEFVIKQLSEAVYARASLETGEVNAVVSVRVGDDVASSPPSPGLPIAPISIARSQIADSFYFFESGSGRPFLWTEGETAKFQFGITGEVDVSPEIVSPQPNEGGWGPADGEPDNQISSSLGFRAYQPGTLALIDELSDWTDFSEEGMAAFQELNARIQQQRLFSKGWELGDPIAHWAPAFDPADVIAVNPDTPVFVEVEFEPGGNFEWSLSLHITVRIDRSLNNVFVTRDFSGTVTARFEGPEGAAIFSESGLFPDTQAVPAEVPRLADLTLESADGVSIIGFTLVDAVAGETWTVLRAESLPGQWTAVENLIIGPDGSAEFVEALAGGGSAFYRVVRSD